MSTKSNDWCRICSTDKIDDNVLVARRYTDIYNQLTNNKYCNNVNLMLCMWCRSILNKTIILKDLALATDKLLHERNEGMSPINRSHYNYMQRLSRTAVTHTNIPSDIEDLRSNQIKQLKEDDVIYVESGSLSCIEKEYLNMNKGIFESQQTIDSLSEEIEYQNENAPPHSKNANERQFKSKGSLVIQKTKTGVRKNKNKKFKSLPKGDNKKLLKSKVSEPLVKQNRIDSKLEEFKFEVRYLSLEEQKEEMERKRMKYKYMKFQCDLCGTGFLTSDYFEAHQIRHTQAAGQYKCSICSLHFRSQLVISQHSLSHKRLFSCTVCGSQFSKWSNCVAHRHKCGSELKYVECQTCAKVFSDAHSLKVHARVHTLKKQYSCEQCSAAFHTKQRLVVHIRSHTGAKPFSCSRCPRSFTTNSNLRAHRAVHSDLSEHYCVECNTSYKTSKSFKRHLKESVRHVRDRSGV